MGEGQLVGKLPALESPCSRTYGEHVMDVATFAFAGAQKISHSLDRDAFDRFLRHRRPVSRNKVVTNHYGSIRLCHTVVRQSSSARRVTPRFPGIGRAVTIALCFAT